MIKFTKRYDDPNGIVSKLIFEDENSIAEVVLYLRSSIHPLLNCLWIAKQFN